MLLSIQTITKSFEDELALDRVSLDVARGEIVCLLGPSGCGKTTLLRIIAGLETADAGQVLFEGQDINPIPPHRRDFGLMFQEYALFPHKSVFDNVAFGLRMGTQTRRSEAEIAGRVQAMLELVGLQGFARRSVNQISGGEAQRVALARSLTPNPRLLMLDEPLGSLDRAWRERLMVELSDILKQVGVTALYVTHDQVEAFAVADRVVIMNMGRVEQIDRPETVYHQPASPFVARFLGLTNLAEGQVIAPGHLASAWGELAASTVEYEPGDRIQVLVRPEAARLIDGASPEPAGPNVLRGNLERRSFQGSRYQLRFQPQSGPALTFELATASRLAVRPGEPVTVQLDPAGVVLLPG